MQVKLYASLRQAAGTKMIEVDYQPGYHHPGCLKSRYPAISCAG